MKGPRAWPRGAAVHARVALVVLTGTLLGPLGMAPVRAQDPPAAAQPAPDEPAAPAREPDAPPPAPARVTYHEEEAFSLFVGRGSKDAQTRARDASRALAAALDAPAPRAPDAADAQVEVMEGAATLLVRGYVVAALYPEDATAAGHPNLETFAGALQTRMGAFVPAQVRRGSLQRTVLHVFLSVFLGLMAVVVLRQLRGAFDRADESLTQRKTNLPALTVLRMPVLGPEGVAGLLALLLDVGRVLAYVLAVAATAAGILGQFDATQPLLNRVVSAAGSQLVNTAAALVQTLPGLLLALVLALLVHGGLRVLAVLLEGVRQGRVTWRGLPPERVPLFRTAVSTAVVLVSAPLVVAAAFGRFGTPLEGLVLGVAGVVLLGAVPLAASGLVGALVLWKRAFAPGEWVDVGGLRGEISRLDITEMVLVPSAGGALHVPMLRLLFTPVQRLSAPEASVDVTLENRGDATAALEALRRALAPLAPAARVELLALDARVVTLRVFVGATQRGACHDVLVRVGEAAARGELALARAGASAGIEAAAERA
jgi:hypothetical protein